MFLMVGAIGCDIKPAKVDFGGDQCHYCRMTIVDRQHAAQAINNKGKPFKFDAIECLAWFINEQPDKVFALMVVNDYENPGNWLNVNEATFLVSEQIPSPMGAFLSAVKTPDRAEAILQDKGGESMGWKTVLEKHKKRTRITE